jgi:hypothetical protein
MRTKRAGYRNIVYIADDDFLYFERKPNFDLVSFTRSSLTKGVEDSRTAQKQLDELTKEILLKHL